MENNPGVPLPASLFVSIKPSGACTAAAAAVPPPSEMGLGI
jgi:hypothetical protein